MKTETILKKVNEYLKDLDKAKIISLKADLEEEIRKESVKAKGLKMDSAIKKMFKGNKNYNNFNKISFPFKQNRGFLDGYRMYVVNDDYGYKKNEESENSMNLDISKIIGVAEKYTIEIKVDLVDLEGFYKITKAEEKLKEYPYILESDVVTINDETWKIGFNSEYLLDMLKAFKTDTIYCTTSNVSPCVTSLDFDGEFGLLLPVKI